MKNVFLFSLSHSVAPEIRTTALYEEVYEHKDKDLTCIVVVGVPPPEFTWFKVKLDDFFRLINLNFDVVMAIFACRTT